jgi:glucokinase
MYVGIDIGGTKTLVAKLSVDGTIIDSRRFPTNHDYRQFLRDLDENLQQLQLPDSFHCCVGIPGELNRQTNSVHALGNLPWHDKPIGDDISKLIGGQSVIIENDARLAGLSEALLIKDKYQTIFFATVSTGIGGALIQNGQIVTALQDMEVGKMPLLYNGEFVHWEDFAGGHSVVKRFNQKASEITDPAIWHIIGENVAYGLGAVCSVLQPEVIILGGGVGAHADKFSAVIMDFLAQHLHAVVRQPAAVLAAQRADDAVIYGCYELAKQRHKHHDH